jgi:hypothetical protein
MIHARSCSVVIASAIALLLGTSAGAQDATTTKPVDTPAPAQDATPAPADVPAPVQEGAPNTTSAPAPNPVSTPEPVGAPAPAQEAVSAPAAPAPAEQAASEPAVAPAPAEQGVAPEPVGGTPASATQAAPESVGTQAPAGEAAREAHRARAATRSETKDVEADRHTPKPTQDAAEPDHIRGQITTVNGSKIDLQTANGQTVQLELSNNLTVIVLTKGSFTAVDFGIYVGSAAVRLEAYSPIVRDSLSWLHKGFELRIIDEKLRGIALGHKKWDLTPDAIIAHGWIDDIEGRTLSIKWGPTEIEETDVEIPRDVPVLKMLLGDSSLIKPGVRVLAGAQKGANGGYTAVYMFVGKDGIVPPL